MTVSKTMFQRASGLSAIGAGLTYIIGFWVYFFILGPAQYGSSAMPAVRHVQFLMDNVSLFLAWNQVIYVLNAVLMVFIVIGLSARVSKGPDALTQAATAFGLIWAGLILAAGMVNHIGTTHVTRLAPQDMDAAITLWRAMVMVSAGLGGGNEITGGSWIFLLSLVAYRGKALPRFINIVGLIVGAAGIVSTFPPLAAATMVFGLGFILWFFAVGAVLIWSPSPIKGGY